MSVGGARGGTGDLRGQANVARRRRYTRCHSIKLLNILGLVFYSEKHVN